MVVSVFDEKSFLQVKNFKNFKKKIFFFQLFTYKTFKTPNTVTTDFFQRKMKSELQKCLENSERRYAHLEQKLKMCTNRERYMALKLDLINCGFVLGEQKRAVEKARAK